MGFSALPNRPDLKSGRHVASACILDVETTGLSYQDEIIELGLVLFAYDPRTLKVLGVVDEYCGLREPTIPIHPRAAGVHGITWDELRGQRLDYVRIESILTNAGCIIAHNASFDRRFMSRLSDTASEKQWFCSYHGISWRARGFPSGSLVDLLSYHHIDTRSSHRALADVYGVLSLLTADPNYLKELITK